MSWPVFAILVLGAPPSTQAAPNVTHADEQSQPASDPDAVRLADLIVVGRRGATEFTPEIELGALEIDALGAYDIGEAIYKIGRRLGFSEPPVVIVNGRRALNVSDLSRFPPDALVRVEALPPEAGAVYGEDPARRVLNIVLQPRYKSRDGMLRAERPTAGGRSSLDVDLRQSEIQGGDTRQFGIVVSRATALRADERSAYIRDHPGSVGITLISPAESVSANFSSSGEIWGWASSMSVAGGAQSNRFVSRAGEDVVETEGRGRNLGVSGGLNGRAAGWGVRFALDGNVSDSRQSGLASFRSRSLSASASIAADRKLIELPAGALRANLGSRFSYARTEADGEANQARLSSRMLDLNGMLSIPLLRRQSLQEERRGLRLGDASVALGGRVSGLVGGAGRGESVNASMNWSPVQQLRFSAQWSVSTSAPVDEQRLAPLSYGAPLTVFDFLTGEAVEVVPLTGGNPDLRPQETRNFTASVSAGPYTSWQLSGSLSFARGRSADGISALPAFTPEVEAAFPDRFTRDADGRLIGVDQRPINLEADLSEVLSSNLSFSIPFSKTPSAGAGYLQFGLNHSWQLKNLLSIHPELRDLDRLVGDGGGMSRRQVSLHADGRYRKWGLNAMLNWRSASRTRFKSGQDGPEDLVLDDFAKVDLRVSYVVSLDFLSDQSAERTRRYDDVLLELAIDNLFDARPEASLGDGRHAPGYGRDDQDPLGRAVRLTLSRRF